MNIQPLTLTGAHVRLEPPDGKHIDDLLGASQFDEIWEFLPFGPFHTQDEWRTLIERGRASSQQGKNLWFTVVRRADARAVGITGYNYVFHADCAVEIGGTWLTPAVWRTAINTESKYLMLGNAFENLGCIRVQLKCDARNLRSQRAIERLGAIKEAVLRKHMITRGGYQRDSIVYSIIDTEWQSVKSQLKGFLDQAHAD
ncbi:MAG: GNAT family N-acetyltransferase [Chloroflexi bacterium]|nr:GNAT family N-acetyltransferase [Chloroflexota bacterium]